MLLDPESPALRPSTAAERLARLEADVKHQGDGIRHLLAWTDEHGREEIETARGVQAELTAVRGELAGLRADIMLAKGAVRASGVLAGAIVVVIAGVFSLIQFLATHVPFK